MKIGYLQKTSLIDYPGKICAVIFTQGCNFRCPYCHNPELVDTLSFTDSFSEEEILSWLPRRKGLLDGVVITGGEPTLQPDLIPFMQKIKDLGFLVKLDTNGSCPDVLAHAAREGLVDYIAMDIKAPFAKYHKAAGRQIDTRAVGMSIGTVTGSHVAYEFRTTLVSGLLCVDDIIEIGHMIKGASRYALQRFVSSKHLDQAYLNAGPFTDEEISGLVQALKLLVGQLIVR